MDSRSFTFGLICGLVVGAFTFWMIVGSGGGEIISRNHQETDETRISEPETVAPALEQKSPERTNAGDPERSRPESTIKTGVDHVAPWPENQRAKLAMEPKDDSWAYYMEQTLLQYLGTHPSIGLFDVSRIECRTTRCQIEVFGFDESTKPVWGQVMYDIRQQPWSEFDQYGSGSGSVDGRLLIVATLHRKSESK